MPGAPQREPGSVRSFGVAAFALALLMISLGVGYAVQFAVPPAVAAAVIAAFVVQGVVYLVPGFPGVRSKLCQRLGRPRLAAALVAVVLAPYLVYAAPTGVFSWSAFGMLAALYGFAGALFLLFPARRQALVWQDVLLVAVLVAPVISGLTDFFRETYVSPDPAIPRLDFLGKLAVFSIGALAFLSLRPLEGTDFRLWPSRQDLRTGLRHYLWFLPFGVPLALGIGLVEWQPRLFDGWSPAFSVAAKGLGIFLATALPEELCFRGILQRLLEPRLGARTAQAVAAVLFGAVHLSFRYYPNWRHALVSAVLGWFAGEAFRKRGSVPAAAVTHTLAVITWTALFV